MQTLEEHKENGQALVDARRVIVDLFTEYAGQPKFIKKVEKAINAVDDLRHILTGDMSKRFGTNGSVYWNVPDSIKPVPEPTKPDKESCDENRNWLRRLLFKTKKK